MKEFLEGSQAVARAVDLARPGVISAYPITPQTHIVEELAQMVADGVLKCRFVNVESEHSACSVVLGASATGVRTFSATSSQGLLLMAEVLFNMAGMRLPMVLCNANRAVSAPINIWNDHSDSLAVRDSGWIQLYAEDNQEACDFIIQAYRISEDERVLLPVMVCIDGYILTHGMETVDIPEQKQVDAFLPPYNPPYKLDPDNPVTMGYLGGPDCYLEARYVIQETMKDVLKLIPAVAADFEKKVGRPAGGLVDAYRLEDAEQAIVAMGSVAGTIKDVVDEMREEGKKVGLLRLITYRPFPGEVITRALAHCRGVAVLEKAISLGAGGPVYTDLRAAYLEKEKIPKISGFVIGLGGRDISKDSIREVFKVLSGPQVADHFIDLNLETVRQAV